MKKKVVLCEFRQESNSFNPVVAGRYAFEMGGIVAGEDFIKKIVREPCAANGMLHEMQEVGCEVIPAYSMVAQSGGPVDQSLVEEFLDHTLPVLRASLPVDCVMVSLHGATQATQCEDVCGTLLSEIRAVVGQETVIAASCDMHANVTDLMLEKADFISGYLTYPHTDYYDVGRRAARMALRRLRGEDITIAAVRVPMIVPASGYTTLQGKYKTFVDDAKALIASGKLLDFSVFQMQPWLDVSVGGSTILAIAQDADTAHEVAGQFAQRLFDLKEELRSELLSIDEIIDIAEKNDDGKPVTLVDSADSTNAGAAGDSAAVVERLLARRSTLKTAIYLNDGPAVDKAFAAGVGSRLTLQVGCSLDTKYSVPATVDATVKALFEDGTFVQEGPAGKGLINNIGPSAVLEVGNISILVCHNTAGNGDPQLYRAFGIEPTEQQLVVAKACTSFRAAYELFSDKIYTANSPGAACADLSQLDFQFVSKDFYPFRTTWEVSPLRSLYCKGAR